MKIAQLVATFPPAIGGMGQVAFEESRRLAEAGHQVTVFTLNNRFFGKDQTSYQVRSLRAVPKLGDAGFVPQLLLRLREFDVIHLHYPWYGGAEWVLLAHWLFKKKYVVTYHMDADPGGMVKCGVQGLYDRVWPRAIFSHAAKVITVDSGHLASTRFGSGIVQKNIVQLYNAVDTTVFTPEVTLPWPIALEGWEKKRVFLFVGNPLPFKRLDWILQALAKINDLEVVLAVVGGGYGMPKYQKLAVELGITDRVRFVNSIADRAMLNHFYQVATALVVASARAESFSLVIIEALAAGCPVIASDIPGVRARVVPGVDGLLFHPAAIKELVEAMRQLAVQSNAERTTMGQAGRSKVVATYGWDKHVQDLLNIYRSV